MAIPAPSVLLPEVQLGEWSAIDTRNAPGLFAYRHLQAIDLLDLPDFGSGDLNSEQRREALQNAVSLRKPLAALALFLGVVALEDYVRDLAARLADMPACLSHFPTLANLRSQPVIRTSDKMFKRLDTDPVGVIDPEDINQRFMHSIGIAPVRQEEYWHLRDLALIRHTIAHHAAVIRKVDIPRFAHFIVEPGHIINPPIDFVRSELRYLYTVGREIEGSVRSAVFKKLIGSAGTGWSENPPEEVIELIDLFGYFGFIETTTVPVGYTEPGSDLRRRQEAEAQRVRSVLLQKCICELKAEYGG